MMKAAIVGFALLAQCILGYYLPGTYPNRFKKGNKLIVEVTKVSSWESELPKSYYNFFKFCEPEDGPKPTHRATNIGTVLEGIRPYNTPYVVKVKEDESKPQNACPKGNFKANDKLYDKFTYAIDENYRVRMSLDNMPVTEDQLTNKGSASERFVAPGYPIGWREDTSEGPKYYIYNHLAFTVLVHKIEGDEENASKQLEMAASTAAQGRKLQGLRRILEDEEGEQASKANAKQDAATDDSESQIRYMVVGFQVKTCSLGEGTTPQQCPNVDSEVKPASKGARLLEKNKEIPFTYTVTWQDSNIKWISRWDAYLKAPSRTQQVHWINILNSVLIIVVMMVIVAMILLRTVRRDLAQYEEFLGDEKEESGWKMVAGDVFRAPPKSSHLAVQVGSGLQIFLTAAVTLAFSSIGFLSPAARGALLTAAIMLYFFAAIFGGYGAVRTWGITNRTYAGWTAICLKTACFYPGIAMLTLTLLNLALLGTQTQGAIPVSTYFVLVALWFLISIPLTYLGGHIATRKPPAEFPVRTNQIPRHVPAAPLLAHPMLLFLAAGLLPFGTLYIELFFVMTEVWMGYFYFLFGFLFVVALLTVIITVEVSILCTYVQLCAEDYRWWWKSFHRGGCMALYVLAYAVFMVASPERAGLPIKEAMGFYLYFSYMALVALGIYLALGFVGFAASYIFVYAIFATVKAD